MEGYIYFVYSLRIIEAKIHPNDNLLSRWADKKQVPSNMDTRYSPCTAMDKDESNAAEIRDKVFLTPSSKMSTVLQCPSIVFRISHE